VTQVWMKPQLKVLVKGKPEEQVLSTCKTQSNFVAGAGATQQCVLVIVGSTPCNTQNFS
jgi:hypothetical protein